MNNYTKETEKYKCDYLDSVFNVVGDEYILVGEFNGSNTVTEFLHTECGEVLHKRPSELKRGRMCAICNKRKKFESLKEEISDIIKSEYKDFSILKMYRDSKNNYIDIRHDCGREKRLSFNDVRDRKVKCVECSGIYTNVEERKEKFIKQVEDLTNNDYEVLGEYVNAHTFIEMVHKECGTTFRVKPNKFISENQRCPVCTRIRRIEESRFSLDEITNLFNELGNGEYTILGEYKGTDNLLTIKHNTCDFIWDVYPTNFIHKNSRCPKCSGQYKDTNIFKENLKEQYGDEYILLSEYEGANKNITLRHNICNYSFQTTPANISSGRGCTYCSSSKNEKEMFRILYGKNIVFEKEKHFDNFKTENGAYYRYDYYLPEYNTLIELDGGQHFRAIEFFGGEEGFKQRVIHDNVKDKYAKDNNIKLIRIPYWEFDNMEGIINNLITNKN